MSQWILGLAVFLSLCAGVFAVARIGGEVLAPIIAGMAILTGVVAVGAGISARNSRVFLGSGGMAVFLGSAALLFSIGSTLAAQKISEFRETMGKADEVDQERTAADKAKAQAKRDRRDADKKIESAHAFYEKADEVPKKNAVLLGQIKTEMADLNKKRAAIEERETKLKARETKLNTQEMSVDAKLQELERDVKMPKMLKKQAAELAAKAEADKNQSLELHNKAETLRNEAERHLEKIKEKYEKLKGQLKVKEPKDKKAVINTLAQIGAVPPSTQDRLREINHDVCHDLCEIAVSDSNNQNGLMPDALYALEKMEPKLSTQVATVLKPAQETDLETYIGAISELSEFGHAGLPLIRAHLSRPKASFAQLRSKTAIRLILEADIKVLAQIAAEDHKQALEMLYSALNSASAKKYASDPSLVENLRGIVGQHLLTVITELKKSEAKREVPKEVLDYFIEMLKSKNEHNRKLGAEALGSCGPGAQRAVSNLKKLLTDGVEDVRQTAQKAILMIETAAK